MNLYQLHDKSKDLAHHDAAYDSIPILVWEKYRGNLAELRKREAIIAKDAYYAVWYAIDILKGPFKAGEAAIAKDAEYAYVYAKDVLKGPFKAGEAAIDKNTYYAKLYARDIKRLKVDVYS